MKKTFRGENSNFRGKFGDSKIVKPAHGGDKLIQKFGLIDLDIWKEIDENGGKKHTNWTQTRPNQ